MLLKLAVLLLVVLAVGVAMRRGATQPMSAPRPKLSVSEAANILGVDPSASRAEIQAAHKRLIRSVHPDRGGSDYLAKQINDARDTMLKQSP